MGDRTLISFLYVHEHLSKHPEFTIQQDLKFVRQTGILCDVLLEGSFTLKV